MDIEDIFQTVRLNDAESFISLADSIDINLVNEDGQNLLHEAAAHKSIECAKALLSRGIDVNHKDKNGMTPLHYCAANSSYDVAQEIVKNGGDLSIADSHGNQPLWTAVFNARGEYDLVKLLMVNNADPKHKNNSGKSPMDFVTQIKDKALISILSGDYSE